MYNYLEIIIYYCYCCCYFFIKMTSVSVKEHVILVSADLLKVGDAERQERKEIQSIKEKEGVRK